MHLGTKVLSATWWQVVFLDVPLLRCKNEAKSFTKKTLVGTSLFRWHLKKKKNKISISLEWMDQEVKI